MKVDVVVPASLPPSRLAFSANKDAVIYEEFVSEITLALELQ
jgi:hypothetical protein